MTLGELIRRVEERGEASPEEARAMCVALRRLSDLAADACMQIGDALMGRLPDRETTDSMMVRAKAAVRVDIYSALDRRRDGN